MTYQMQPSESLPAAVRRIAREEVDGALTSLESTNGDRGEGIHDARKRFKKIRAVLRLVRFQLGDVYQRENVAYRDAGRLLAEAREADVVLETLDDLVDRYGAEARADALDELRARLEERRERVLARAMEAGGAVEQVRRQILEGRDRIAGWPVDDIDFGDVLPGVRKVYRRGVERMDDAYAEGTGPAFHEWRKRVKYLWYHLRILTPVWPRILEPWAEGQHELATLLGDGNDLTDLLDLLEEKPSVEPDGEVRDALLALARRCRGELWDAARPLGRRLYAEEPDAMVARLEGYVRGMRLEERAG